MRGLPLVALLMSGCASFEARPIEPEKAENDFRSRSLSDPGLRAYVERNSSRSVLSWPPPTLDLESLTLVALNFSPELEVARALLVTAEAAIVTAGARPNPSVGVAPGFTESPESPWLYGVTFDIPIETAGKRRARVLRAEHLMDASRWEVAQTAWQVRSRVRAALLKHIVTRLDLTLLEAQGRINEEMVALLERRYSSGEASRLDVDRARMDLSNSRLAIRSRQGQVAEALVGVAVACSLPLSAVERAELAWPELEDLPDEASLTPSRIQRAGLLNRLDVRRALAEYAAAESQLRLQVAKQYPDLHLGPGYSFDDGSNKFELGVSIELPVFNRNRGPIAEAEGRRREAEARFLALQSKVVGDSELAFARYRGARTELSEVGTLVRNLQEQEVAARRAFEVGETDSLTLSVVRLQETLAARARLAALQKAQEALGSLEDAVQKPLGSGAPLPEVPVGSP